MPELKESLRPFVAQPNVSILATLRKDGTPHMTAVWYEYVDGVVKVPVTEGRLKYKHALRDPRVSLAIASQGLPYRLVVFEGTALFEPEGGQDFFRRQALRYYGEENGTKYADYDEADPERRIILHYEPSKIIAYDFAHEDDYHRPWGESRGIHWSSSD